MSQKILGVIGGSGLYAMEGLTRVEEIRVETPFGEPSDVVHTGFLGDTRLMFLARHGRGHRLLPSEVPYRANIYAMKKLGVERIISISAVGSMKENLVPGHVVIPDQFFDRTTGKRDSTFFGNGLVGHIPFADPVCGDLSGLLAEVAQKEGAAVQRGGTYLCIEGPNFSTRAESNIFRSWGVDIIGMTNLPEARLAREAEICYATLAMVTDYDCWHEEHEDVSVEAITAILQRNVIMARRIIATVAAEVKDGRSCACKEALRYAIMTPAELIPAQTRADLDLLIGKYL
jgi:5'-methylthioadenosine phosphorylase